MYIKQKDCTEKEDRWARYSEIRGTQWKGLEIKGDYVVIMAVIRIQLLLIGVYKCYWQKIATKRYNVNKIWHPHSDFPNCSQNIFYNLPIQSGFLFLFTLFSYCHWSILLNNNPFLKWLFSQLFIRCNCQSESHLISES